MNVKEMNLANSIALNDLTQGNWNVLVRYKLYRITAYEALFMSHY